MSLTIASLTDVVSSLSRSNEAPRDPVHAAEAEEEIVDGAWASPCLEVAAVTEELDLRAEAEIPDLAAETTKINLVVSDLQVDPNPGHKKIAVDNKLKILY